ncbi:MAG: tryptophan synthase subunit alpha, partial [Coxiellaceae bacterium]|nr:tryptophan synthase subunit alpha [Coxiellaceae bacterium]
GMLYYVMRSGTTGLRDDLPADLTERLDMIKRISNLPVVAGFGISNRDMASAILDHADGFVVGSFFVKAVADGVTADQICTLAKSIDPR